MCLWLKNLFVSIFEDFGRWGREVTVNACVQSTMFNQKFVLPLPPPASALLQTLHQLSLNIYRFPVSVVESWQTTHAPTSPSSAWSPKQLSDGDIQHYELTCSSVLCTH